MMTTAEIVVTDEREENARGRRLRRWLRIGIPVLGVILVALGVIATTYYSYTTNRKDAQILAKEALSFLNQRISFQVDQFMAPASRIVKIVDTFGHSNLSVIRSAEALGLDIMEEVPQVSSVFFGTPSGDFLMVKRDTDGSFDTKQVTVKDGRRVSTWVRRDTEGRVVATEEDPGDAFDPRTRPWFEGAIASPGVFWSPVYVFFTDRTPGVTASAAGRGDDGAVEVVMGVDISLASLSEFLAQLKAGRGGRVMIIDGKGRLIASPDPKQAIREQNGELVAARIDELGDRTLTEIWDRLRLNGPGEYVWPIGGEPYMVTAQPGLQGGRDWMLLTVVPERDIIGFVAENNRTMALMSLVVVGLAASLAVMLGYWGLRADRNARLVEERQQALQAQGKAFADIAGLAEVFDPQQAQGLGTLLSVVARTLGARRVSLWRIESDGTTLTCEDCFDQEARGETAGMEIRREDCAAFFRHLATGEILDVADAASDMRTNEVFEVYLRRVGCRALLSVPILHETRVVAVLWIEDPAVLATGKADALTFARAVANMLAVRFSAREIGGARESRSMRSAAGGATTAQLRPTHPDTISVATRSAMRTSSLASDRRERFNERLAARGLDVDGIAGAVFPDTTVFVLRFSEQFAMTAMSADRDTLSVLQRMVALVEEFAAGHDVDYLKIMNDQIVSAAGIGTDALAAAAAMAELALTVQDLCARLVGDLGQELDFTVGIDSGTVIGSPIGFGRGVYNFWGEAVRGAVIMATTAPRGGLQVSESTYRLLAERYVFRPRGAFYLDGIGELSTYLLRGRL